MTTDIPNPHERQGFWKRVSNAVTGRGKGAQERAIRAWQKSVVDGEVLLMQKARAEKDNCIMGILMMDAVYVIEDDTGKPYTKERLEGMTHGELLELLEYYVGEMKKDYGDPDK